MDELSWARLASCVAASSGGPRPAVDRVPGNGGTKTENHGAMAAHAGRTE